MFQRAHLELTLLYSLLFLLLFWAFTIGLYAWMNQSFGESYISEVQQQNMEGDFDQRDTAIAATAGEVALDRLRSILLALNGGLVVIVPLASWLMTRRVLAPVQQIHDEQKQFVSDVAHELRTPLSIASGELEVALRKERTIPEYQQVLTSSKEETDHLSSLVENLLFLARVEQGKRVVTFERVDLTDLLGGIIASLQAASEAKRVALHFSPGPEPTFVWGQPSMLQRLFLNLIQNAILYTPAEGTIWITLSGDRLHVRTEVRDTGIGISPDDQQKIFDRFYRADPSRSQTEGYGLGLAICKSIIEQHHGKITVRSALGQGSTFIVLLPDIDR